MLTSQSSSHHHYGRGFYEEWFKEIETLGWYWLCRIRGGKSVKLSEESEWKTVKELIPEIKSKTAHYEQALLTKEHERACRMVTTHRKPKGRKVKTSRYSFGQIRVAVKEKLIRTV